MHDAADDEEVKPRRGDSVLHQIVRLHLLDEPLNDRGIRRVRLQREVARHALAAEAEGVRVLDLAREVVRLAAGGLAAIAPDEVRYLDPLAERVLDEGICPADRLIADFEGSWHGDATRALESLRI